MESKDLKRVVNSVIRRYPLTCGLALAKVEFELNDEVGTASIAPGEKEGDPITLAISPEFFDLLSFSERGFIIAHEALHIAFKHIARSENKPFKSIEADYKAYCLQEEDEEKRKLMHALLENKYHNIWNKATDACINALLKNDGYYSFPSKVVDPKTGETMKFVDMDLGLLKSAEYIYDYLIEEEKKKEKEQENNPESNDSSSSEKFNGEYQGIDSHKKWKGKSEIKEKSDSIASNENEEDLDKKHNNESFDESLSENKNSVEDVKNDLKQSEQNEDSEENKMDELEEFEKETENREKRSNQKSKDLFKRIIPKYEPKEDDKPVLSWQDILKSHIMDNVTLYWSRRRISRAHPNSRIEEMYKESIPPVELILDTSGSISTNLLKRFISEVYMILDEITSENVLNTEIDLKVGCFATSFTGFKQITNKDDIEEFRTTVGGGTDFEVATTSFTKNDESIKIVFTDGLLGDNPKTYAPDILWIVFNEKPNFTPLGGKVIKVDEYSLKTLKFGGSRKRR